MQVEGTYYFKETLGKRKPALIVLQENYASVPSQLLCRMWGREKLCDANKERRGILFFAPLYTHTKQIKILLKILYWKGFDQAVLCQ